MNKSYKVVLTGGICCGKSTVTKEFASLGVDIIDADLIAREIVEPQKLGWKAINNKFGSHYFHSDKRLNRRKLRQDLFKKPKLKLNIEKLLHPIIKDEISKQCAQSTTPFLIIDIPLFADNPQHYQFDRVLVVDAPVSIQLHRLIKRDQCSIVEAKAIINSQSSRADRLAIATDVLVNDSSITVVKDKVKQYHQKYLKFSQLC